MIAKVYVNGHDVRTVRGESVEDIARAQFARNGQFSVKHEKGTTYTVTRPFGSDCSGIVGRIRIVGV
jgi:hypothetical protein